MDSSLFPGSPTIFSAGTRTFSRATFPNTRRRSYCGISITERPGESRGMRNWPRPAWVRATTKNTSAMSQPRPRASHRGAPPARRLRHGWSRNRCPTCLGARQLPKRPRQNHRRWVAGIPLAARGSSADQRIDDHGAWRNGPGATACPSPPPHLRGQERVDRPLRHRGLPEPASPQSREWLLAASSQDRTASRSSLRVPEGRQWRFALQKLAHGLLQDPLLLIQLNFHDASLQTFSRPAGK